MNNTEYKPGQLETPVAFMIFNRPEYTKAVFAEIRKAQPKKLFIVADGPRTPSEEAICIETRAVVENIDWPCEIHRNYAERNLGLKERFRSGLNWYFENVEEGIILEDDCLPHPSFFRFTAEMLEKYKNDERVMMISGSNYVQGHQAPTSYFFSRCFSIWGWATWRRAWQKYDGTMNSWPQLKKEGLNKYYSDPYARRHIAQSFENVYSGKTNTWDTQWFFTCLVNSALAVVPSKNLISNIGVAGTHQGGFNQNLPIFDLYEKPLKHPSQITENTTYDSLLYQRNFRPQPGSFFKNIKWKIIGFLAPKPIVKKLYRYAIKIRIALFGYGLLENVNDTKHEKSCLFMYIIEPFKNEKTNFAHQSYWQSREFAKIIGDFGYNVDVIQFNDKRARLTKKYDLVVDLHPGMNLLYKNYLNPGAKRIAYITGSNVSFSNQAENERIENIYQRRGVRLRPQRQTKPFDAKLLSSFNAMFFIGNDYNLKTYAGYTPKKVFLIKNTGYDFLAGYDYTKRSPKSFLFLAGGGQAHKGLDLLLEVFAKNPDLKLYVCSSFKAEKDFCELYKKELFETKNIHPLGFVDINSFAFIDILKKCSFLISPSCSEGQSGSVLAGMSAGLIPIVSKESGFDATETFILDECTTNTISKTIKQFSLKSPKWITAEGINATKIAHEKFGRDNFSESIKEALIGTLVDNDKHPLISVIIPTHNSAKTIGIAIDSIVNQTYPNLEIIVVDDNSADNTEEIVKNISKIDSRVKYFSLPFDDPQRFNKRGRNINAGYMARNYGFDKSHGEWVTFQDADDASLLNRIEVQYNFAITKNSSHVCVQCTQFKKEYLGKKMDIKRIFKENENLTISTKEILKIAQKAKGVLIPFLGKFNEYIPFEWKRLRVINKLFFGSLEPYPGSGNCPLVKREVFDKVKFNPLNKRTYPSFMGRGVDRDFNFRVAETFKDSICLKIPLYLWNPIGKTTELKEYKKYLYD